MDTSGGLQPNSLMEQKTREEESKQRQEDDNFSFLLPHFADGFMGMFSEK